MIQTLSLSKKVQLTALSLFLAGISSIASAELLPAGNGRTIDTTSIQKSGPNLRYVLVTKFRVGRVETDIDDRRIVEVDCVAKTRRERRENEPDDGRPGYSVYDGTQNALELDTACKFAEQQTASLVSSDATAAPLQKTEPKPSNVDPSFPCFNALESDAKLKLLLPKVGQVSLEVPKNVTFEMMVSKSLPTKAEKDAVKYWGAMHQQCVEQGQAFRAAKTPQAYVQAYSDFQRKGMQLLAKLYGGTMNYGQFIAERESLSNEINQKIAAIIQELQERARAQAQAEAQSNARAQAQAQELARAQAESAAQARALAELQARADAIARAQADAQRAQANRDMLAIGAQLLAPRPIQAPLMPPTVNCRSWQSGNTVQTRCD